MAFGFGGGSGSGFGQTNNTGSTFGGFGSTNNTTPAFGGSGTGFGATNNAGTTGTGLFGGGGATTGGFGSGTTTGGAFGGGGFGAAKPAFGTPATTTGGTGLFGGTTTATTGGTGFGGFGAGNTASTSTPFGGGSTSLFGASKPATTGFGGTTSAFGGNTTTTTGGGMFGGASGTAGTGFGATNNPGIGTNVGDPPGTAVVPFSPTVEKEANNTSQSCSYQNLLFMDNYKKWSADELRLADYNAGRKSNTTGGGFGAGSGFGTATFGTNTATNTGGFGTNTGTAGLFGGGGATTTGGGFGAAATTNPGGGFGTNTGGGLFGAKPATAGGVFGSTAAQPAAATGGGLFGSGGGFGTNTNTTGGFGSTTNNTGGGLFGANSTTAAKPAGAFGGFGTNTTSTGFGGGTTTTPAFGTNTAAPATGGGLFGNTAANNNTGGGLFGGGAAQQPAATSTGFGGFGAQAQNNTGGGLFGASAAKPATGGGLFGGSTATTGGGGLFGGGAAGTTGTGFGQTATAQPAAGGLFGAKPAAPAGGLFGGGAASGTTGGGFGVGGAAQPQQQSTGLFGALGQNNQPKPGGLFGGGASTGGGLFGNSAQSQGGGLFGNSTQQQPQLGTSLLGASQGQQQAPQAFSTSINDISAYGASTLFSGLPDDKVTNPGPLATPLTGKPKAKSRSILPMYKLSPANASRFVTPQKRGYGFSYSAYGSPATPSSVSSTPGGLGQSLLASSANRALSKSVSASNLRRSFNVEDSILQPGAFSANSSMRLLGNSNSHKKLIINKDMRSDLFTSPDKKLPQEDVNGARKLSKRVSFDTSTVDENRATPPQAITDGTTTGDLGYLRPTQAAQPSTNGMSGSKSSPVVSTPEMEQVKGKELAIVHEEESPAPVRTERPVTTKVEPGEYWMNPPVEEIRAMNRMQRMKVPDFEVGRTGVGSVKFKVPVDLTNINLDDIFDNIVVLLPRSATVYPVSAQKPPVGKGLNVPALISLEQSWPRGGEGIQGRRLEKHIQKLKTQIPDTKFEDYERDTGVWRFSVEHFTTYGLDDDDDDDYDEEETEIQGGTHEILSPSDIKESTSPVDPDDTFEFKRSRRAVPGAFDHADVSDDEDFNVAQHQGTLHLDSLDADAPLPSREWPEDEHMADGPEYYQHDAYEYSSQQGSVGAQDEYHLEQYDDNDAQVPAGILRARMRAYKKSTAPTKIEVAGGDDWTQILQASVRAPRTMDRATLRELNESGAAWDWKDRGSPAPQEQVISDGQGFATSIDLMKSLFEQAKGPTPPKQAAPAKGFVKWPYQKRTKVDEDEGQSVPRHNWGPDERLITTQHNEPTVQSVDEALAPGEESATSPKTLAQLQQYIDSASGYQGASSGPQFRDLAQGDSVWELASLLFDDNGAGLTSFWKQLVSESTKEALAQAQGSEEKAIMSLAGNLVPEACGHLLSGGNSRLAILVASIGRQNKDIKAQLRDWRESNVLSEIAEPIRAIYELLAGNACVCAGVKDVPIESRVNSFVISQRFGLDWIQSFGLRLFYSAGAKDGGPHVGDAIRSFQHDIEQGWEPEPDSPLWSLLKAYANQEFDWSDTRLGWLMTRAIHATGKVSFGEDDTEKLDHASLSFASALTAQSHWVPAAFVLLQLSDPTSREAAVRDHLGRHARLIGAHNNPSSNFSALRKFGVPENWIWEAKALDFRSRQDTRQEFLALVWGENYVEANNAFVKRVGPDLIIERDYKRLFEYAQLLFKVKKNLPDFDRAAIAYLLYPMARLQRKQQPLDRHDDQLFDALVALRGETHGDICQEAAIADMAEELIKCRGGEPRLFTLLPSDVRGKYMRAQALANIH
ncbi:hypothetical protein QBC35DRAFT_380437 [Podospora australis]|uniref:Peptidase S59 domain-containing protein n=1 Tax=Podospora australis TaxID=1536484 RepID=A0AAN7AI12_9PEZI|nr:hypothetical protein QBC35DRAFT_380437 [Podospora australis]